MNLLMVRGSKFPGNTNEEVQSPALLPAGGGGGEVKGSEGEGEGKGK